VRCYDIQTTIKKNERRIKMTRVIEVEVDLAEYEDDIRDYLNGGIKEKLAEYVMELYKELYIYHTKKNITVEQIYNDLDRMMKEF
jgi:hypothetical protein